MEPGAWPRPPGAAWTILTSAPPRSMNWSAPAQVKKHLTLSSPANGIVTKRMVTQGMYVQAGMPLLEVADLVHRLGGRRYLSV